MPDWKPEITRRLESLKLAPEREAEIVEELAQHLDDRYRELVSGGATEDEARRLALEELSDEELLARGLRQVERQAAPEPIVPGGGSGGSFFESLWQDIRYGIRQLRRNPGFTIVAVLTLALGIGASTAMFSVIECGILDPFPYTNSHRMAVVVARYPNASPNYYWGWFPVPEFLNFRAHNHVFEQVMGYRHEDCVFTGREEALDLRCLETTGNLFQFEGVRPLLGRAFTPSDAGPGAPPVVVLRYTTWQSKFGGDPKIVGRTVTLNAKPRTIIGVMPPRFTLATADFWVPHDFAAETAAESTDPVSLTGLLKPGVSFGQAAAEIKVLAKHWETLHPKEAPTGFFKGESLSVESLLDAVNPDADKMLYLLFAAVGLVLAIACANVANLLLSRATTREGEIAIRASLGAGRRRLARQFMVESLLLAAGGGLLGCLFAWPALKALMAVIPAGYIVSEALVRINQPVLLFAAATAVVATLLFGLAPALHAARKDFQTPLNAAGRGAQGGRRQPLLRNLLVIGEFTLSLILMTGAGLFMRSFIAVRYDSLGYDPNHVLQANLDLPQSRYKTAEERSLFSTELLERLRTMHGVVSAAFAMPPPFSGKSMPIAIAGSPNPGNWTTQMGAASDASFATMRIPLLEGRDISAEDCHAGRKVAVVNQSFVHRFLAGQDPIGREITVAALSKPPFSITQPMFEIIGVAADTRNNGPGHASQPSMYVPYTVVIFPWSTYVIRTTGAPGLLLNPIRRLVARMDSNLPVEGESLEDILTQNWYTEPRFLMTLMSVFAALGLALVLVGIYSVLSYSVARRTHEIGVRMALGAGKGDVLRMVVGQGLKLALVGVAVGVAGALALTRFLANQLYGVKPTDPFTFIAVSLILIAVALLACYIPARRAAKVDPIVALRYE
jgi:putative ABC transport system permease protein